MSNKEVKKGKEINVIVLKNRVHSSKQEIIDDYIDVLKTCRTAQDFYSLLEQLYDEVLLLSGERFVELQIAKNAEILEEMRREFIGK